MVKPPKSYKSFSSEKGSIDESPVETIDTKLRRFCFLYSFEPVYVYNGHMGTTGVKVLYKKIDDYCKNIEEIRMKRILHAAYDSKLPRRDEVAFVHAAYLMADIPSSWKNILRIQFPLIVKDDTDLFLFCKYAALIHHEKNQQLFCKTVKKAIKMWYKQKTPEEIAYMFAANRGKNGFTHRILMKLCRISDDVLGTKYLYRSFTSSCKELLEDAENPLPPLPVPKPKPPKMQKVFCKNNTQDTNIPDEPQASTSQSDSEKSVEPPPSTLEVSLSSDSVERSVEPQKSTLEIALPSDSIERPGSVYCDQEKIRSIILAILTLRASTDPEEALELINKFDFKYEHLPYHLLQFPEVLKAVAKSMPCTQLIKCLNSKKIRKHFSKQDVLKVFKERFQRKGGLKGEGVDPILFLMTMDKLSIMEPLKATNNKNTSRGRLVQFCKQLFRVSFWETNPIKKRIHITINLQHNYLKRKLKNTKGVTYQFAAAALAFAIFKVEERSEVYRWTDAKNQLEPLNWYRKMDFSAALSATQSIHNLKNNQRLYMPIVHCNERQRKVDLFIVIVPSATRGNSMHSSTTLAEYLDKHCYNLEKNSKFVIVDLLRHKRSMKYSKSISENILEICGLDEHTIPLIYNFALDKFD